MSEKQSITEKDGIHEDWYKEAGDVKTPDEAAAFMKRLLSDYDHDYGTICHAIAAAQKAAFHAMDQDKDQGGITGFQAGCIMWSTMEHIHSIKGPSRLLDMKNLLYPQYAYKFNSISKSTAEWLKNEAKKKIKADADAHPDVLAHWGRLAEGAIPFGLKVKD